MADSKQGGPLRKILRTLGPGLITGAADDDPAGITTYSQAGAAFQYGLLWTALLQIPLMIGVQYTCARIGLMSGRNLARVLHDHYPRWILWAVVVLLVIANTITAAADIAGIAAGAELLTGVSKTVFVPITGAILIGVVVFGSYRLLTESLKWLALALFGYLFAGVLAGPDWGRVLHRTFVPGLRHSYDYLVTFVGVFGTTISPYLFVWQSAEEVDEEIQKGRTTLAARRRAGPAEAPGARLDTIIGMVASQLIGFFIIIAAGATLYPSGNRDIGTAREAAQALQPIGSGIGTFLFSVGLIGTGLLAVPTLAGGSAFAVAALADRPASMTDKVKGAPLFYGVIAAGILIAVAGNFTGVSPVTMLFGSAVVNGILAPPLLLVVLLVANNSAVMGEHTNGWVLNLLTGIAAVVMAGAALWLAGWWVSAKF